VPASVVPDFRIIVNGAPLPPQAQSDVASVVVEESVTALSTFAIELANWDPDQLRVAWSDGGLFAPGGSVQIAVGYLDDVHEVMDGEITGVEPVFAADRPPMVTIRGYDHGHRLTRGRKTRAFVRESEQEIVQHLAREGGLRAQISGAPPGRFDYVLQANQSDLEFLRARASRYGCEVFVRGRTLTFRPPPVDSMPMLTLDVGELTEFSPRLSLFGQVGDAVARGWEMRKKTPVVGRATARSEVSMGPAGTGAAQANRLFGAASDTVVDVLPDHERAESVARGQLREVTMGFVRGDAGSAGLATLRAGSMVEITGAGRVFSGRYYVPSVTHVLSEDEGYRTSFDVRRNAT
jgi:phage protein D